MDTKPYMKEAPNLPLSAERIPCNAQLPFILSLSTFIFDGFHRFFREAFLSAYFFNAIGALYKYPTSENHSKVGYLPLIFRQCRYILAMCGAGE